MTASKTKMTDLAVPLIILINVAVYYFWNFPPIPGTQGWLQENFVCSRNHIKDYQLWTLVTSLFFHRDFLHLLISTVGLISIGLLIEDLVGSRFFAEFFLVSGLAGSMNHVMISPLLNQPDAEVYGATAPLTAVMVLAALIYRDKTVWLFKFIPIKPAYAAGLFILLDLLGMPLSSEDVGSPIGHGAHVAAAAVALIYYHKILRHRVWRNLRSEDKNEKRLYQVNLADKVNVLVPCDKEEYEDMVVFLRDLLGMKISKQGTPDVDNKIARFTRFNTPSGFIDIVEPDRFSREIFANPMLSITVDNLTAAVSNLDARNVKFVAPIFHKETGWAMIYFKAPDGRVYQIQGPYANH